MAQVAALGSNVVERIGPNQRHHGARKVDSTRSGVTSTLIDLPVAGQVDATTPARPKTTGNCKGVGGAEPVDGPIIEHELVGRRAEGEPTRRPCSSQSTPGQRPVRGRGQSGPLPAPRQTVGTDLNEERRIEPDERMRAEPGVLLAELALHPDDGGKEHRKGEATDEHQLEPRAHHGCLIVVTSVDLARSTDPR